METPNDRTPSPPPPYESEENAPVAHCAAAASEAPPGSRVASLTAAPVQLPAPRFREAPGPAPVPGASSATTAVMLDVVLGNSKSTQNPTPGPAHDTTLSTSGGV